MNMGLSYVERMEEQSRDHIIYKGRQVDNPMLRLKELTSFKLMDGQHKGKELWNEFE